jgi:undecaprenyl phosphate N,N'-diacetylbacillosamine 1-phosphate transferase
MMIYRNYIKRISDFIFSLLVLVTLSPLILIICIVQFSIYKFDVFYFQPRTGFKEKKFTIIKFRTMKDSFDQFGKLLPDSNRVTKFGKFLRLSSLDELPNLVNVVLGHMSIVGPRPLPIKYLSKMSNSQRVRYSVKPGITGLAQISGRNELNWSTKISLDLIYVKKTSLLLDLKIVMRTLMVLFDPTEAREISFDHYEPNFKQ